MTNAVQREQGRMPSFGEIFATAKYGARCPYLLAYRNIFSAFGLLSRHLESLLVLNQFTIVDSTNALCSLHWVISIVPDSEMERRKRRS